MKPPYKKNFTLLELLVVISILVLLAGVMFMTFDDSKAERLIVERELKLIGNTLQQFKQDNGEYPDMGGLYETHDFTPLFNIIQGSYIEGSSPVTEKYIDLKEGQKFEAWNPKYRRGWNGPYLNLIRSRKTLTVDKSFEQNDYEQEVLHLSFGESNSEYRFNRQTTILSIQHSGITHRIDLSSMKISHSDEENELP